MLRVSFYETVFRLNEHLRSWRCLWQAALEGAQSDEMSGYNLRGACLQVEGECTLSFDIRNNIPFNAPKRMMQERALRALASK
jgi:hypothetical protein